MKISVKKLTVCAMFIALSFIFSNVRILGSIAFDSMPAFLGGLILGGVYGAVIGAFGHMCTALISGFPYSLPVHIITAALMALTVYLFTLTYKLIISKFSQIAAYICAGIVGIAFNGPICVIALSPFLTKMMPAEALIPFTVTLSTAAFANITVAYILSAILVKSKAVQEG